MAVLVAITRTWLAACSCCPPARPRPAASELATVLHTASLSGTWHWIQASLGDSDSASGPGPGRHGFCPAAALGGVGNDAESMLASLLMSRSSSGPGRCSPETLPDPRILIGAQCHCSATRSPFGQICVPLLARRCKVPVKGPTASLSWIYTSQIDRHGGGRRRCCPLVAQRLWQTR